jgi:hypothetical protein
MRVQIPAYADQWMKGDRYGEVVKTTRSKVEHYGKIGLEIAHVKLDISGKTMRYLLDDCTVV